MARKSGKILDGIIYRATAPNGKRYYGLTIKSLNERKSGHEYATFKKKSHNHFHNAIRYWNKNNIIWEIVEYIESSTKNILIDKLKLAENKWVVKDKTYLRKFGYNLTKGGDVGLIESSKLKISNSVKNLWKDPSYRKKHEETLNSPEFKKAFKKSMLGVSSILSSKIKDKWKDPIYRNKLIQIRNSTEFKEKLSKSLKTQVKCPRCNKKGSISPMKQWHFNNCKSRSADEPIS